MNRSLIRAVLVTLCCAALGAAGCTTTHMVNSSPEALAERQVGVGDRVTLYYVNGRTQRVKLTAIGGQSLVGSTKEGGSVEKQFAEIVALEYEKIDVRKTAGATLGVVAITAVVVASTVATTAVAVAGYR